MLHDKEKGMASSNITLSDFWMTANGVKLSKVLFSYERDELTYGLKYKPRCIASSLNGSKKAILGMTTSLKIGMQQDRDYNLYLLDTLHFSEL